MISLDILLAGIPRVKVPIVVLLVAACGKIIE